MRVQVIRTERMYPMINLTHSGETRVVFVRYLVDVIYPRSLIQLKLKSTYQMLFLDEFRHFLHRDTSCVPLKNIPNIEDKSCTIQVHYISSYTYDENFDKDAWDAFSYGGDIENFVTYQCSQFMVLYASNRSVQIVKNKITSLWKEASAREGVRDAQFRIRVLSRGKY